MTDSRLSWTASLRTPGCTQRRRGVDDPTARDHGGVGRAGEHSRGGGRLYPREGRWSC
jgi:hypothetical protein